jgi:hypothetical protein
MRDLTELELHSFAQNVLERASAIEKLLGNRARANVVPEYTREPDEHEYFLLGVATAMAELLNCCQQLSQIPVFLASHRQTAAMDKAGINRHSMIVYHIENYLIRTQSVLDRTLKLVDAVFHLTNDPRNCRFDVVMRNVKVQISDIHEPLKKLRKLLERYTGVRNEIIHHHSIKDDALRRLEMYFLLERWEKISPSDKPSDIKEQIKDNIFEILWFKKKELVEFNNEIEASLKLIFDRLAPYYRREESALRLRLSKSDNQS